jgi:hypothetical protein
VFPDQLALDYRMGLDWGPSELEGLFDLLVDLAALDPQASLSLQEGQSAELVARFQNAWHRWVGERAG